MSPAPPPGMFYQWTGEEESCLRKRVEQELGGRGWDEGSGYRLELGPWWATPEIAFILAVATLAPPPPRICHSKKS